MAGFLTTNIRLPAEMMRSLKLAALEEGKSVSQMIRESIQDRLGRTQVSDRDFSEDPFFEIGPVGKSGRRDASERHDDVIYGTPALKEHGQ